MQCNDTSIKAEQSCLAASSVSCRTVLRREQHLIENLILLLVHRNPNIFCIFQEMLLTQQELSNEVLRAMKLS